MLDDKAATATSAGKKYVNAILMADFFPRWRGFKYFSTCSNISKAARSNQAGINFFPIVTHEMSSDAGNFIS